MHVTFDLYRLEGRHESRLPAMQATLVSMLLSYTEKGILQIQSVRCLFQCRTEAKHTH